MSLILPTISYDTINCVSRRNILKFASQGEGNAKLGVAEVGGAKPGQAGRSTVMED